MLTNSRLATETLASPNHGERKLAIDAIVLHYTGMENAEAALQWMCNPASQVSSHYLVRDDGDIIQLVAESRRAWHAGHSFWAGVRDINSCSIGIEIVNPGHDGGAPPFGIVQVQAVIALCRDIIGRHGLQSQRILAHSDIAPHRKRDPGEMFPWIDLHNAGVGHWVVPHKVGGGRFISLGDQGAPVAALQSMLAMYGYDVARAGLYDGTTQAAVTAFQRHFRPLRVDGIADISTIATLRDLIASLPSGLAHTRPS